MNWFLIARKNTPHSQAAPNIRCLYIMHKLFLAILVIFITSNASAKEYGNYDPKRLLIVSETATEKKYGLDIAYFDQILKDLSAHANSYPPRFDTPQDKQRATQDAKALSVILDTLINTPTPNPEFLIRAGHVNSIGHNLDIPGAAEKANTIFLQLLDVVPSDPHGNYMYGTFLAGAGQHKEALPYLEKALAVGVTDAEYSIGMTYLFLGDTEQALINLENYKQNTPNNANTDTLIEAIRNGNFELKSTLD